MSIIEGEPQAAPVSVTLRVGGKDDHLRDGQARQAGRRRSRRPLRRHHGPRDRPGPDGGPRRRGLLPAHDRRRGADVRRREDPRRLLQARGAPDRAGDPDRAHDRPPDPAALAEGLPQRGAVHRDGALGRPDHPARHPRDQRHLGGADDLADAVPRPDRRRPHRPDRRRARRQPDAARGGGGRRARPDRRRHEGRPDDGRGGREPGARGRRCSRRSTSPSGDREALRGAGGAPRAGRQAEVARRRRHRGARRPATATRSSTRIREHGLREGGAIIEEIVEREAGRLSMESTEDDIVRELQVRMSLAADAREEALRASSRRPVREQFENDLRGAHRGRAGLEGAQVGEAAPALRPDRRDGRSCRSRSARPAATRRSRTR